MKRLLFVVACLALVMGGCALFGHETNPDGTVKQDPGGGVVGRVFSFAGLPWVGTAIAAIGGIVAEKKRRGWKGAALSTFAAIEAFKTSPEGKKIWESLKAKLGEKHAEAHVTAIVDKALGNVSPPI